MRIAEFPLNPMFAKMLLESGRRKKKSEFFQSCAEWRIWPLVIIV